MKIQISRILTAALFCFSAFGTIPAIAQSVTHPASEVSSTAKHYSYRHMLSPTQKKELEYILVRASNGEIKTVFNACDVCYAADKGYSQTGTQLRCNNCGNRFQIDGLGSPNTAGTCNPGYLPHSIDGENVTIQVSDLLRGLYYFPIENVTGLDEPAGVDGLRVAVESRSTLQVNLDSDAPRQYSFVTLTGVTVNAGTAAGRSVRLDISTLSPGMYMLLVEQRGAVDSRPFLVY